MTLGLIIGIVIGAVVAVGVITVLFVLAFGAWG